MSSIFKTLEQELTTIEISEFRNELQWTSRKLIQIFDISGKSNSKTKQ